MEERRRWSAIAEKPTILFDYATHPSMVAQHTYAWRKVLHGHKWGEFSKKDEAANKI